MYLESVCFNLQLNLQEIAKDLHTDPLALFRMELAGEKIAVFDGCIDADTVFGACCYVRRVAGLQIV